MQCTIYLLKISWNSRVSGIDIAFYENHLYLYGFYPAACIHYMKVDIDDDMRTYVWPPIADAKAHSQNDMQMIALE